MWIKLIVFILFYFVFCIGKYWQYDSKLKNSLWIIIIFFFCFVIILKNLSFFYFFFPTFMQKHLFWSIPPSYFYLCNFFSFIQVCTDICLILKLFAIFYLISFSTDLQVTTPRKIVLSVNNDITNRENGIVFIYFSWRLVLISFNHFTKKKKKKLTMNITF